MPSDSQGGGNIVGWGDNTYGQATPPAGNDFVAIAGGECHSLALHGFTIRSTVLGGNGSVSPATQTVRHGKNAVVTITPDAGCRVESIHDNDELKTIATPYVISNAQDDHYVVVMFALCVQPSITTQPQSLMVTTGQKATLTASGTAPFSYQWYEGTWPGGGAIIGATRDYYTTPALTSDASYWVRAVNDCGTADSQTATFIVGGTTSGPQIASIRSKTHQPGSRATIIGTGFTARGRKSVVYFGSQLAKVNRASTTRIIVIIPRGLHSGDVVNVVVLVNGTASNSHPFEVE